MFGGDWGVQRQKQFLLDLPDMFRSMLLIVHSICFTAAMAHDIFPCNTIFLFPRVVPPCGRNGQHCATLQ